MQLMQFLKIELPEGNANSCYGAESIIKLNVDKLKSLGWKARYNLKDIYARLIGSYKDILSTRENKGEKRLEEN